MVNNNYYTMLVRQFQIVKHNKNTTTVINEAYIIIRVEGRAHYISFPPPHRNNFNFGEF